ncbi:MAG: hypothetical protein VYE40_14775 [Myxococcota bacterium]|nr:hypothetical protein [Myxococcota bacterium]
MFKFLFCVLSVLALCLPACQKQKQLPTAPRPEAPAPPPKCTGLFTTTGCETRRIRTFVRSLVLFENGDLHALANTNRRPIHTNVSEVATNSSTTCLLMFDGTIQCKGSNEHGALGQGDKEGVPEKYSSEPLTVELPAKATHITSSGRFCALLVGGDVWCWGDWRDLRFMRGKEALIHGGTPKKIEGVTGVTRLLLDRASSCALDKRGDVKCWKQSGEVNTILSNVRQLEHTYGRFCAVTRARNLKCWSSSDASAEEYWEGGKVIDLAMSSTTCAISASGEATCWRGREPRDEGKKIIIPENATRLVHAGTFACAFDEEDHASCWGASPNDLVAKSPDTRQSIRREALDGLEFVSKHYSGKCYLFRDGRARCTGQQNLLPTQVMKAAQGDPVYLASEVAEISLDEEEHCMLGTDGALACWSARDPSRPRENDRHTPEYRRHKRFLERRQQSAYTPEQALLDEPAASVQAHEHSTCAITRDAGEVWCWGFNDAGLLPGYFYPESSEPIKIDGLAGVKQIAFGQEHRCARNASGEVWCWGRDDHAQLGGSKRAEGSPVKVQGLPMQAVDITVGSHHSCALLERGAVACWGYNLYGQLGHGPSMSSAPRVIEGLGDVKKIAAAGHRTCALTGSGAVKCWGWGEHGALGQWTDRLANPTPLDVPNIEDARTLEMTLHRTCARSASEGLMCWGHWENRSCAFSRCDEGFGEAAETTRRDATPAPVLGANASLEHSVLQEHMLCGIDKSAHLRCWGLSLEINKEPSSISYYADYHRCLSEEDASIIQLTRGGEHTCVLSKSGKVHCAGQVAGDGSVRATTLGYSARDAMPRHTTIGMTEVDARVMGEVAQITSGSKHSCALDKDGKVWCWGNRARGQLGDGGSTLRTSRYPHLAPASAFEGKYIITRGGALQQRSSYPWYASKEIHKPEPLPNARQLQQVRSTHRSLCALNESGEVWCWGQIVGDTTGEQWHGDHWRSARVDFPVAAKQIAMNEDYLCIRSVEDAVWCWGKDTHAPRKIEGLPDKVQAVHVTSTEACAITQTSGEVWCWESRWNRCHLLDEKTSEDHVFTRIEGIEGATHFSSSGRCAFRDKGKAWCWYQQPTERSSHIGSALPVSGVANTRDLIGDHDRQCALSHKGKVSCWKTSWNTPEKPPRASSFHASKDVVAFSGKSALHRDGTVSYDGKRIKGIRGIRAIDESAADTCGLLEKGGGVLCWGHHYEDAFGVSSAEEDAHASHMIPGIEGAKAIFGKGNEGHCVTFEQEDRLAACWTSHQSFVEWPLTATRPTLDEELALGPRGKVVEIGQYKKEAYCVLDDRKEVWCWGYDNLANFLPRDRYRLRMNEAARIEKLGPVKELVYGQIKCALQEDGEVVCWSKYVPEKHPGLMDVVELKGSDSACARHEDGSVSCWGHAYNFAHRSDGTRYYLGKIKGVEDARALFVEEGSACAITGTERSLVCWNSRAEAQRIEPLKDVTDVFLGNRGAHCAKTEDGKLWCWGGVGRTARERERSARAPIELEESSPVQQVAIRDEHLCILFEDHRLMCWEHRRYED